MVSRPENIWIALILVSLVAASACVTHAEAAPCWSQFHGNVQHTGASETTLDVDGFHLLWSVDASLERNTQPAVSEDGTLVFAYGDSTNGNRGNLTAFAYSNGATLWMTTIVSRVDYESWSSPIYHEGYVYWAGSDAGTASVYKINSTNGSWSGGSGGWKTSVTGDIVNASPTVIDGRLFISTYAGFAPATARHIALTTSNGAVLWNVRAGGQGQGAMAYDSTRNVLYQTIYTNSKHRVAAFDPVSGTVLWVATWRMQYDAYPCAMVCTSNRIYCQDFNFGGPSWLYIADPDNQGALVRSNALPYSGDSAPTVDPEGNVYTFGDWNAAGQTFAFNASGSNLWTFPNGGGWTASPTWADHRVFTANQTGNVISVLNDSDGSVVTTLPGSGPVAFGSNAFYTIGLNGTLYAYLANDGGPHTVSHLNFSSGSGTNSIQITHRQRADMPNIQTTVEFCTNLLAGTWTTNGIAQRWNVTPTQSGQEDVVTLLPAQDRSFIRLRIRW